MDKKRILYAILFVVAIAGVIGLVMFFNNATANRDKNLNNVTFGNRTDNTNTEPTSNTTAATTENENKEEVQENTVTETNEVTEPEKKVTTASGSNTTVKQLSDGTLYQLGEPLESVDIVVGDNMYNTQITDFNLNFSQYEGKTIEIEGMYFLNTGYTFVGRFSNVASTCCPQGYAYFEYEWHGDQKPRLVDSVSWIKVRGTLTRGEDEYGEYYYIDTNSFEVMNQRGIDTVNN